MEALAVGIGTVMGEDLLEGDILFPSTPRDLEWAEGQPERIVALNEPSHSYPGHEFWEAILAPLNGGSERARKVTHAKAFTILRVS